MHNKLPNMHIHDPFHEEGSSLKKVKSKELLSYGQGSENHINQSTNKHKFLHHNNGVYLEPLKGKQKRPKFLLDFKIHGINNIPLFNDKSLGDSTKGVCYLKWHIANEKDGTINNHHVFHKNKTSKNNVVYLRDYEALKFFSDSSADLNFNNMSREELEECVSSMLPNNDNMHPSATNTGMYKINAQNENKAISKRKGIANNSCQFDYQPDTPTILKFNIDEAIIQNSSKKMKSKITRGLKNEYLVIEVFSEVLAPKEKTTLCNGTFRKNTLGATESEGFSMKHSTRQISNTDTISVSSLDSSMISSEVLGVCGTGKSNTSNKFKVVARAKLGTVSVNLADYISEDEEWKSHNFLLQDSKINSVMTFSCHLKLIRGSYNDFDTSEEFSSNQMPASLPRLHQNKSLIAQKFKEKHGLHKLPHNSRLSSQHLHSDSPISDASSNDKNNYNMKHSDSSIHGMHQETRRRAEKVLSSALLSEMKYKNYSANYLRNPYEYVDPKDCIKDILDGKSGWNIDAIFSQPLEQSNKANDHETKPKTNDDFLELEKMLNKYGSTRSVDATLKNKKIASFGGNYKTKYKTTGGWLFSSISHKEGVDTNGVEGYPINEMWQGYDDRIA